MVKGTIQKEITRKNNYIQYGVILENNKPIKVTHFDGELELNKVAEFDKNTKGFWQFKNYVDIQETKESIEQDTTIPNADEYIVKQQDEYLYGRAFECAVTITNDVSEQILIKNIKLLFEVGKKARKECLGY